MAAAAAQQQLQADLAAAGFDIDPATLATATTEAAPPRWPTTAHTPGIPIWHNMTLEQKQAFLASIGENPDQIPTVETFEFGSLRWNEYASGLGVRLLTEAVQDNRLTIDGLEWGFSEEYTCTPGRLMDGQGGLSGYYVQISGGRISGGPGVPPSCLALEGFHAVIPWALYAHSSLHCFNTWTGPAAGCTEDRATQQTAMWNALRDLGGHRPSQNRNPVTGAVWPDSFRRPLVRRPVGAQLAVVDVRKPEWAPRLLRSPELEGLPETEWGVPLVSAMSGEDTSRLLQLAFGQAAADTARL